MTDTAEQTEEHPIIFNSWSIRRILAGEKTQTRRIVKPQPPDEAPAETAVATGPPWIARVAQCDGEQRRVICPYGQPGDMLWVREAFRLPAHSDGNETPSEYTGRGGNLVYWEATDESSFGEPGCGWGRKRPSIHMPRELCRLRLRVEDVHVERVQDIQPDDVDAEGVANRPDPDGAPWQKWETADGPETNFAHIAFRTLWNDIHGDGAWDENPWVWVVEFLQIDK